MLDVFFEECLFGNELELHPIGYRSSDGFLAHWSKHWSDLGDCVTFEWS